MVDSKENYKFDLGVEGLINTFGWDFVNKVWLFRYGCVFERYIVILLSERGLHSQSSLRFDFFFSDLRNGLRRKKFEGTPRSLLSSMQTRSAQRLSTAPLHNYRA